MVEKVKLNIPDVCSLQKYLYKGNVSIKIGHFSLKICLKVRQKKFHLFCFIERALKMIKNAFHSS